MSEVRLLESTVLSNLSCIIRSVQWHSLYDFECFVACSKPCGPKSEADEISDHPVSPKSLVTEVGDVGICASSESYLRPVPTVGCHGDTCGGQTTHNHRLPLQQPQQPHHSTCDNAAQSAAVTDRFHTISCRGGECCRNGDAAATAIGCRTPTLAAKTVGAKSRHMRQNHIGVTSGSSSSSRNGGGGGGGVTVEGTSICASTITASHRHAMPSSRPTAAGYQRATSCIEVNKYTHIWEMPLPVPGE